MDEATWKWTQKELFQIKGSSSSDVDEWGGGHFMSSIPFIGSFSLVFCVCRENVVCAWSVSHSPSSQSLSLSLLCTLLFFSFRPHLLFTLRHDILGVEQCTTEQTVSWHGKNEEMNIFDEFLFVTDERGGKRGRTNKGVYFWGNCCLLFLLKNARIAILLKILKIFSINQHNLLKNLKILDFYFENSNGRHNKFQFSQLSIIFNWFVSDRVDFLLIRRRKKIQGTSLHLTLQVMLAAAAAMISLSNTLFHTKQWLVIHLLLLWWPHFVCATDSRDFIVVYVWISICLVVGWRNKSFSFEWISSLY